MEEECKMEKVRNHFEEEAKEFDQIILKLIPYYEQMIETLISVIPFDREEEIEVIDLGCGTGNILKKIREKFPNARLIALDISKNMIEMTKVKLGEDDKVTYRVEDFL